MQRVTWDAKPDGRIFGSVTVSQSINGRVRVDGAFYVGEGKLQELTP